MICRTFISTLLIPLALAVFCTASENDPAIVPWPKTVERSPGILPLEDPIKIFISEEDLRPIAEVFGGELAILAGLEDVETRTGSHTGDIILRKNAQLQAEEYRLEIAQKVILEGGSFQAIANGTATLLQSLVSAPEGVKGFAKIKVVDSPDTTYRGLMVDVARQWHTPEVLKDIIQLCRLYKIRFLQLHLTDDQAWTVPLKAFPKISTEGHRYELEALKELVAYADARGVTLIPEIDMPAHSSAICRAMPELFRSPNGGIINFASEDAVQAMTKILDEVCSIFTSSPYLHLGADEANLHGLDQDPQFQAAFKRHDVDGIGGLFNHFLNRMNRTIRAHGKTTIVWEGFHLGNGKNRLAQDIVVMPFDNYRNAETYYIEGGHRVINTSWYPLYVVGQPPLTSFIYDWDLQTFGNFTDPFPRRTSSVRQYRVGAVDKILGAQLCSWEQAGETEIRQLRRPLPALSERIWNRDYRNYESFRTRLAHTDKILNALLAMVLRGI